MNERETRESNFTKCTYPSILSLVPRLSGRIKVIMEFAVHAH